MGTQNKLFEILVAGSFSDTNGLLYYYFLFWFLLGNYIIQQWNTSVMFYYYHCSFKLYGPLCHSSLLIVSFIGCSMLVRLMHSIDSDELLSIDKKIIMLILYIIITIQGIYMAEIIEDGILIWSGIQDSEIDFNPLNVSVALIEKPVNWFAQQICKLSETPFLGGPPFINFFFKLKVIPSKNRGSVEPPPSWKCGSRFNPPRKKRGEGLQLWFWCFNKICHKIVLSRTRMLKKGRT